MYEQLTQLNIKINNNNKRHNQNWAEDLNRHFSKENTEMANKYMERCSTLLVIRVVQIKATMRYHFTPVRTAIIQKFINNKYWRGFT